MACSTSCRDCRTCSTCGWRISAISGPQSRSFAGAKDLLSPYIPRQIRKTKERSMKVFVSLLALFASVPVAAQVPDNVNDTMRRIFASADFAPQRFGPARWIENGTAYTTVERSAANPDASDIVRYETATGVRSVYISARQLVPSGASEALDFDDYAWSTDGNLLLLFTNTQRVWRQNTRGNYWVLNRKTGALQKLGGPNAPP